MVVLRALTDAGIGAVAEVHVRSWPSGHAGILAADYLAALDPAAFARTAATGPARPGPGVRASAASCSPPSAPGSPRPGSR